MKKKLISVILALTIVISVPFAMSLTAFAAWDGSTDTAWYNETDTEFEISTAEQLAGFASLVTKGNAFEGKTVKLIADLDLNGDVANGGKNAVRWAGIGGTSTATGQFKGIFDGQGHVVSNIYTKAEIVGLFARPFGTIQNLGVENFLHENSATWGGYVGLITGLLNEGAVIRNCYTKNSEFKLSVNGNFQMSGIAGRANGSGTIENCYAVNMRVNDAAPNGIYSGITSAANANLQIRNCYALGYHGIPESNGGVFVSGGYASLNSSVNCFAADYDKVKSDSVRTGKAEYLDNAADLKNKLAELGDGFKADPGNLNNGYPVLQWEMLRPDPPEAPDIYILTPTSILVEVRDGEEYSTDGIHWNVSGIFDGLESQKSYSVYARTAQTADAVASKPSEPTEVTLPAPGGGTNVEPKKLVGDGTSLGTDERFDEFAGDITYYTGESPSQISTGKWYGRSINGRVGYDEQEDANLAVLNVNVNNGFLRQYISVEDMKKAGGSGTYRIKARTKVRPAQNDLKLVPLSGASANVRIFYVYHYFATDATGARKEKVAATDNWLGTNISEYDKWYDCSRYYTIDLEKDGTLVDGNMTYNLEYISIDCGSYGFAAMFSLKEDQMREPENQPELLIDDFGFERYDFPSGAPQFVVRKVDNPAIRTKMGLAPGQTVDISFNDAVTASSLTEEAVMLEDIDGNAAACEVSQKSFDTITVTLPELKKRSQYKLRLTKAITSQVGKSLSETEIPIETGAEIEILDARMSGGACADVRAAIGNNLVSAKPMYAFAGVYQDGVLTGPLSYQRFTAEPDEVYVASFGKLLLPGSDCEVRVFVWDDFASAVAMTDAITITQ